MSGPHGLPELFTSFVGREAALAEVRELLGANRLVTIVGSGGSGKTRLAIEAARAASDEYAEPPIFCDLARISDPALVAFAAAGALGVHEAAGPTVPAAIESTIGRRRLLLLFDNAEHVAPELAELVSGFLRSCPNLRLLVTSRRPLGTSGEAIWRLAPMQLPELPTDGMANDTNCEAVELFVTRARAASAGTKWDAPRLARAASICARLDGIPLAIELAAARTGSLGLEDLEALVSGGLAALAPARAPELQRHTTLKAAIDWSYQLLDPDEQTAFRCLAVFSGGATLAQITEVCADHPLPGEEVIACLSRLVDHSMVTRVERNGAPARYRLLEPLRDFAREELESHGECDSACARHAAVFLRTAEGAKAHMRDAGQVESVRLFDSENDNMRVALEHSLSCGDYEAAARFTTAMDLFWRIRARYQEARRWALAAAEAAPEDSPWRARALRVAGCADAVRGDITSGLALLQKAAEIERKSGDERELSETLCWLGQAYELNRLAAPAFEVADEAEAILDPQDRWLRALHLRVKAHAEKVRSGDMASVQHLHEQEYALCREAGDYLATANVMNCLGEFARWQGDFPRARILYLESLARRTAIGDEGGTVLNLANLALLSAQTGECKEALDYAADAHARMCRIGNTLLLSSVFLTAGAVAARLGRFSMAARLLGMSRESARSDVFDPPDERVFQMAREICLRSISDAELDGALALGRFADVSLGSAEATAALEELQTLLAPRRPELQVVSNTCGLSEREKEIIQFVAGGMSNKDIAERLVLSTRTVETHVANAYSKLGVNNRAEATARAFHLGLVPGEQRAG